MSKPLRTPWSWLSRFSPPPLVDAQTIERIHQAANSDTAPALLARREVQHMLLGERQSAFVGRGYEYAENRPYQAGDEARFINWRVLARTGLLYQKTFYEERRPPVWLILDRGASMRFGTRVRLKLTLAAQLALYHLFLAQRRALAIGAVLYDSEADWFAPAHDSSSHQALVRCLTEPSPPLAEFSAASILPAVLRQCLVQLDPGCIIILYSDFQNLQAHDLPLLHALAQRHSLYARHIVDVSELHLPQQGDLSFAQADEVTHIDCSDSGLTRQFEDKMRQRHREVADWFSQAGIDYQRYRADETLFVDS
ncbi:MAG: DUF58 domain-containing protein [Gammaproteobacteria bacterium]|jgi:uncharacterized protein (DUF58 family)